MKVLAISGGSIGGNTELILLSALAAIKSANPDTSMDLVRLDELSIGKSLIAGQMAHPFHKDGKPAEKDNTPDDRPFVLNLFMEADAILLGAPVYNRGVAGLMKWFQDKTIGPFQDICAAKDMMAAGRGQMVDQRLFKPRVAAIASVGGALSSDWTTFGLPLLHQIFFPMGIKVVDQMQVHGAGLPGCVILDDESMARAAELGKNLISQALQPDQEREYVGKPGSCPMCNLNIIVLVAGNQVECATCGAKGEALVVDGNLNLHFSADGLEFSVMKMSGLQKHADEIKAVAGKLKPRMGTVPEKKKELAALAATLVAKPPRLQ